MIVRRIVYEREPESYFFTYRVGIDEGQINNAFFRHAANPDIDFDNSDALILSIDVGRRFLEHCGNQIAQGRMALKEES